MPIEDCSDIELLQRWASGDRNAGSTLIDRHSDAVHRYFANKVGGDELEDLMQQTFLACLEHGQRFRKQASFRTFLLGIARFQLYSFYGKRRRDAGGLSITAMRDPSTSPTGALTKHEDEQLLHEALRHISLEAQELLELSFWEELSAVEIADILDVPVNTIYSRMTRAKEALRAIVRQLAPDHTRCKNALRLIGADAPSEGQQLQEVPCP